MGEVVFISRLQGAGGLSAKLALLKVTHIFGGCSCHCRSVCTAVVRSENTRWGGAAPALG